MTAPNAADFVLDLLGTIAAAGDRCPTGEEIRDRLTVAGLPCTNSGTAWTTWLARAGHIRIEVFGKNWRVITILTGPHIGKKTKAAPRAGAPYVVIDALSGFDTPLDKARRQREANAAFDRAMQGRIA